MEFNEHKIRIERTAHYYTLGKDIAKAKQIWIAFHGYGQLASRIIRKFDKIDLSENFIIAPEGLSKFYFKRDPEILGASWMTKHRRLDEIQDYLGYIDKLYTTLVKEHSAELNVLGFSQGSTTMMRWVNHRRPSLHRLIIWAGDYPKEIDYNDFGVYSKTIPQKYLCFGSNDEFLNQESKKRYRDFIKSSGMNFDVREFEGKHEIDRELLFEISQ